jgi:hypothetical protein
MPPTPRGLISPAIITSTIVLILCALGWGALGMASLDDPSAIPSADHRYLCIALATVTLGSTIVHMTARALRTILVALAGNLAALTPSEADGYAQGYADGLSAAPVSPAVPRLVPAGRR